jgi:hypothetical protein
MFKEFYELIEAFQKKKSINSPSCTLRMSMLKGKDFIDHQHKKNTMKTKMLSQNNFLIAQNPFTNDQGLNIPNAFVDS